MSSDCMFYYGNMWLLTFFQFSLDHPAILFLSPSHITFISFPLFLLFLHILRNKIHTSNHIPNINAFIMQEGNMFSMLCYYLYQIECEMKEKAKLLRQFAMDFFTRRLCFGKEKFFEGNILHRNRLLRGKQWKLNKLWVWHWLSMNEEELLGDVDLLLNWNWRYSISC